MADQLSNNMTVIVHEGEISHLSDDLFRALSEIYIKETSFLQFANARIMGIYKLLLKSYNIEFKPAQIPNCIVHMGKPLEQLPDFVSEGILRSRYKTRVALEFKTASACSDYVRNLDAKNIEYSTFPSLEDYMNM